MTGAEALQKIIDTMDTLKSTVDELKISIQLIEANIKTLNNRAAGLMKNDLTTSYDLPNTDQPIQQKPQQFIQAAAPVRGRQLIETPEEQRHEILNEIKNVESPGVLTYKKVFGRLVNNTNEPIENVLVKIYDKNNEVCATAETDPIGYWELMLRPGRYVAEYTKSGFKAANKTFEIGKNAKEVEVK